MKRRAMKKQGDMAIQTCLMKMSDIMTETASKSNVAAGRGFPNLARSIHELSSADFEKQTASPDLTGDSLEKVNYYIDLALNTFESIQAPIMNDEQQTNFFFALSETFETLGNYSGALRNYTTLLSTLKDPERTGQVQYRIGRIYAERGDWEKAGEFLNDAIQTLRSISSNSDIALAQIELAKIAYRKGDYVKAQGLFQAALETSEIVNDIRSRATVSNHLGIIRRIWGEYELAYNHFHQALIEFQSIQDLRGAAETMNNLGVVHLRRCELEQAKNYFEKSHQLCQETGYFALMAFVYLNKAEYYCELGDGPMAANICHRALEYIVRLKNPIGIAKINMLFGRIFWKSEDLQSAEEFYKTSMSLYQEFSIPLGLANCYREYARMQKESGNAEEVITFNSKADAIYNKLGMEIGDGQTDAARENNSETKETLEKILAMNSN